MMNEAIRNARFAVVCAPLANVDRRAISQAWYSALHLQTKEKAQVLSACRPPKPCELPANVRVRRDSASGGDFARARAMPAKSTTHFQALQSPAVARRTLPSALVRKIERLLLSSPSAIRSGTLALDGEHGRVHIVIRLQGSEMRIIAVCAPKARDMVRAALEHARYALARTGTSLVATLHSKAS